MSGEIVRVGMIMCNRYRTCAGGKCFRAMRNREGSFSIYAGKEVELIGCTTCGGCPGGNIEYAPAEMKKNGVTVIHLATGMLVGYPPCTRIDYFRQFIQEQYGIPVVVGTHPIPQKYFKIHDALGSWKSPLWQELIQPTLATKEIRLAYD
jgi:predicted metal-binding protein